MSVTIGSTPCPRDTVNRPSPCGPDDDGTYGRGAHRRRRAPPPPRPSSAPAHPPEVPASSPERPASPPLSVPLPPLSVPLPPGRSGSGPGLGPSCARLLRRAPRSQPAPHGISPAPASPRAVSQPLAQRAPARPHCTALAPAPPMHPSAAGGLSPHPDHRGPGRPRTRGLRERTSPPNAGPSTPHRAPSSAPAPQAPPPRPSSAPAPKLRPAPYTAPQAPPPPLTVPPPPRVPPLGSSPWRRPGWPRPPCRGRPGGRRRGR